MRLHAGGDPDQHALAHTCGLGDERQPGQLLERVEHHPADAGGHRPPQLLDRLVVAVKQDPVGREAGALGYGQLPAGAHVQGKPLGGHPAGDRDTEERLARVVDVAVGGTGAERDAPLAAPLPEVILVQHVRRGAVLERQVADVDATDRQHATDATGGARPDGRVEGQADPRLQHGHRRHIRSGALTPSRPSPLASTTRVASHSQSRARPRSLAGSSPCGSTRQAS